MQDSEQWDRRRNRLLEGGDEVHPLFNISRIIGNIVTLDYIRTSTGQRLLSYPASLTDGVQPIHPDFMPFPLIRDGKLTHDGIDIREIPKGTTPLLRVAQSFDTKDSGAPQRGDIFRQAGVLIATVWHASRGHLPEDINLRTLSYTSEGEGTIAFVPPSRYIHTPNPIEAIEQIGAQIEIDSFAPDMQELSFELRSGAIQYINSLDK